MEKALSSKKNLPPKLRLTLKKYLGGLTQYIGGGANILITEECLCSSLETKFTGTS